MSTPAVQARGAEAQGHTDQGQDCAPTLADLGRMVKRLQGVARDLDRTVSRTTDRPPPGSDPYRSPLSPPRQDRASIGANVALARRYLLQALDAAGETWTD